jgi:hypothetical protein
MIAVKIVPLRIIETTRERFDVGAKQILRGRWQRESSAWAGLRGASH